MKHKYCVYRTVTYTERIMVYAENREKAVEEAKWLSDDIDTHYAYVSPWVAELDEEAFVKDLLNEDCKRLNNVVETMFDEEVKK